MNTKDIREQLNTLMGAVITIRDDLRDEIDDFADENDGKEDEELVAQRDALTDAIDAIEEATNHLAGIDR